VGSTEIDSPLGGTEVDTSLPVIGDNITQPWYKGTVSVQLTATDSDSGVAAFAYTLGDPSDSATVWTPYTGPFDVSGQGTYTVSYYATDNAGNRTDAQAVIHIDDTTPVTTATPDPSGWTNANVTVTLAATDSGGSGLKATYYKVGSGQTKTYSAPITLTDGTPLSYWSVDNAGNVEQAQTLTPQIDTTRPTTSATPNPSGWTKGPVTVTLAASDSGGSGLKATYYQVGSGQATPYSAPITLTDATPVSYWSVDNAGNVEVAHTITPQIDTSAPVIGDNITQPWYNSAVTVKLTATDAGSGVKTFRYTLGDPSNPATVWIAYTAPFKVSSQGSYTVSYYAIDNVGNRADAQAVVRIDTTAPVTTISKVSSGWYDQNVPLTFGATDAAGGSGVAYTEYSTDGGATWNKGTAVTISTEGVTTVLARSKDNAGNVGTAKSSTVKIDKTAPTITLTTPANGAVYTLRQSVKASWAVSDALSGVASQSGTVKSGSSISTASVGTKTFTVTATDKAGNTASKTVTYQVK